MSRSRPSSPWRPPAGAAALIVLTLAGPSGCDRRVAGGSTEGDKVFAAACASCHGPTGTPPPTMAEQLGVRDLNDPEFRGRRTRDHVIEQVRRGSANHRMPAFTGALTDAQIEAVADYVMSLGDPPPGS